MSYNIIAIPAFSDNYIWTIIHRDTQQAVVVDPGDAKVTNDYLQKNNLKLVAILLTHHHWDHTGGVKTLKAEHQVPVFGPKSENIPYCDNKLANNDTVDLFDLHFEVLAIPGHTLDHIAFLGHAWLFCGDTLFSAGCGRLFEGSAAELYDALCRFSKLPGETKVYCAHEYTLNNLKFAKTVEPDNPAIDTYIEQVTQLRQQNKPSLPSTIERELNVNPFLRCEQKTVIASAENYSGKTRSMFLLF
jgi:hydroxyacylglutathione hydrolase